MNQCVIREGDRESVYLLKLLHEQVSHGIEASTAQVSFVYGHVSGGQDESLSERSERGEKR